MQPFEVDMHPRRKTLVIVLCSAAVWYGWTAFARSASEVVTLHVSGARNKDYYARLWVVEARPYLWIRAEKPDRSWLRPLQNHERPVKAAPACQQIQNDDLRGRSKIPAIQGDEIGAQKYAREMARHWDLIAGHEIGWGVQI